MFSENVPLFSCFKMKYGTIQIGFLKMILKLTYSCKMFPPSTFKYSFYPLKNLSKGNLFLILWRGWFEQSCSLAWGCRDLGMNVLSLPLGVFSKLITCSIGQDEEMNKKVFLLNSDAVNLSFYLFSANNLGAFQQGQVCWSNLRQETSLKIKSS